MKKKIYFEVLLAAALLAIGLSSCGDCDLLTAEYPCRIREATITKFDPRLILEPDSSVFPVPTYSIHTFTFPFDNSSSGYLQNDVRFDQGDILSQYVVIAEEETEMDGRDLKVQLVSYYPTNPIMVGDVMVIGLDSAARPMTADLRFYGSLARFPDDFESEDAYRFCEEYLTNYRETDEDYEEIGSQTSLYGENLPNAVTRSFTRDDIIVIDEKGRDVSVTYRPRVSQLIVDDLLNHANSSAVDLRVTAGEVYFYRARNNKEFAVIIADIRQGSFEPYLRRVTIKFSELKGMQVSQCPD